jgi:mono/diheme cytochrome c family protein
MRRQSHTTRNIVIVAIGFVALVVAAGIAGDSGFALAVGLVLIGLIAMFVPLAVITHEEREVPIDPRPSRPATAGAAGSRSHPVLFTLAGAILVGIGLIIGIAIESGNDNNGSATGALKASSIGNATVGRHLFVTEHCSDCHSFEGRGGSDGPPLDYMRGQLAAKDLADMTGQIWNHLPAMERALKEEKIPFPTFSKDEMADLIAYLHGGGPPPDLKDAAHRSSFEMSK